MGKPLPAPYQDSFGQIAAIKMSVSSSFDLIVVSLLINILGLAMPLALAQIYDRILPNKAYGSLIWLIVGSTLAVFAESLLRFSRDRICSWLGVRYEHKINGMMMSKVLGGKLEILLKDNIAVQMDRLKSIQTLRNAYCNKFYQSALDLPFSFAYIWVISLLSHQLALVVIGVAIGTVAVTAALKPLLARATRNTIDATNAKMNFIIELISKIHFIKALAQEEQMTMRFGKHQARQSQTHFTQEHLQSIPGNISTLVSQLSMFSIIAVASDKVIDGSMTLGLLTACMTIGTRAIQPIQSFASHWFTEAEIHHSHENVKSLLTIPDERTSTPIKITEEITGSVYLDHISFRYNASQPLIFTDLVMQMNAGEMIGISSSYSKGSTTLLQLIAGLIQPNSGRIYLDDYDIALWPNGQLHSLVWYMAPQATLLNGTILENIALFDKSKYSRAMDTVAMIRLNDHIAQLPEGYNTQLNRESIQTLPSAVIQMIALAQALVVRPKVFLINKADAAFDDDGLEIFIEVIKRLKGHATFLISTDNHRILKMTDAIYKIQGGVLTGTSRISLLSSRDASYKVWAA